MTRKPALHDADDLLSPALERAVSAVDAPPSDDALVALARVIARTVDRMTDAERANMLGQTGPLVLKVLVELERRAEVRRTRDAGPRQPSKLDALRAARSATGRGLAGI